METPSLEYFDTFKGEMGGIREESTVRFFDQDGRMLALRPDLTMPVARMAAVRPGRTGVQRYCYIGNAYGMEPVSYTHLDVYKRQLLGGRQRRVFGGGYGRRHWRASWVGCLR